VIRVPARLRVRVRRGLRDYLQLVRAPAALSVPGDVVAGAAAGAALGPGTAGLAAASVCLYWAGMAANDWADREVDRVERPERPIPSGRVTPGAALGLAAGLTAAALAGAGLAGGRRALGTAVPLAAAVWAYDLSAKAGPAGPAVMATCRGLNVLLGASPARRRRALPAALTVAAHTYTVTALSRHEVHGCARRVPAATLAATAVVATATAAPVRRAGRPSTGTGVPAALAGWYAARYGGAQTRTVINPNAARIRAAVATGITDLPVLQGALLARSGHPAGALLLAAAAPLGARLARRVAPT
jgi:4-hydroxybenzoate polyprenyltransferase